MIKRIVIATTVCAAAFDADAQESPSLGSSTTNSPILCARGTAQTGLVLSSGLEQTNSVVSGSNEQDWNLHVQNTEVVQGYPAFPAKYSGPNSLPSGGESRETVSLDLYAGVRLWQGAEAHIDGLMWQGFGLGNTEGVEGFPNGEAVKFGTELPAGTIARLFIRQTIGFGGEQEDVPDSLLTLAGKQDISRLTLTLGRFAAPDIFDKNTYA